MGELKKSFDLSDSDRSFIAALFVVAIIELLFIVLKVAGVIDWPWLYVAFPVWGTALILFMAAIGVTVIMLIYMAISGETLNDAIDECPKVLKESVKNDTISTEAPEVSTKKELPKKKKSKTTTAESAPKKERKPRTKKGTDNGGATKRSSKKNA